MLINAVHTYAPELIILSGGATLAADLFINEIRETVNRQAFYYSRGKPIEVVVAKDQEFTGIIGAAAYVMRRLNMLE